MKTKMHDIATLETAMPAGHKQKTQIQVGESASQRWLVIAQMLEGRGAKSGEAHTELLTVNEADFPAFMQNLKRIEAEFFRKQSVDEPPQPIPVAAAVEVAEAANADLIEAEALNTSLQVLVKNFTSGIQTLLDNWQVITTLLHEKGEVLDPAMQKAVEDVEIVLEQAAGLTDPEKVSAAETGEEGAASEEEPTS